MRRESKVHRRESARREISARQVRVTCVHVIPCQRAHACTVARALPRVAEAADDSAASFAAGKTGRNRPSRLRTRDDPWIPTSEWARQTGETQWPRERRMLAASMPFSSSSLARTARGNAFYFILNKIFGLATRHSADARSLRLLANAITAADMSWYDPDRTLPGLIEPQEKKLFSW